MDFKKVGWAQAIVGQGLKKYVFTTLFNLLINVLFLKYDLNLENI